MTVGRSIKSDRGSVDDDIIEDADPDADPDGVDIDIDIDMDVDIDIDVGVDPIDIESYEHKPELGSIEEEGEEPMLTVGGDRNGGIATADCDFLDGGSSSAQGDDTRSSTNENRLMPAKAGPSDEELIALAVQMQREEQQNDSRGRKQEGIPFKFAGHRLELSKQQQQQKKELQGAIEALHREANKQEEKIKLLQRGAANLHYGHNNYQPLGLKQHQLQYLLQRQHQQNRQVQFSMAQKQAFLQRQFQHERCGAQQIGYNRMSMYDPMMIANPQGLWPGTYALGNLQARARSPEATTLPPASSISSTPRTNNTTAAYATRQQPGRTEHLQKLKRSKEEKVRISLRKLNRLSQEIQDMERFAFESTTSSSNTTTEEQQIREVNGDPSVRRIHAMTKNDPLRQKPNSTTDSNVQNQQETGNDTPDSERKKRSKTKQEIEALNNEKHQTLKFETGLPIDGLDSMFRNLQKRHSDTGNPCNQHLSHDEQPRNYAVTGPSNDDHEPELDRICGSSTNSSCNDLQKMRTISSSPQRLEEIADQLVPVEVEAILKRMERSCRDDSRIDTTSKNEKPMPDSPEEAIPDSFREYVTTPTAEMMNEEPLPSSSNTSIQSFSPAPSGSNNRLGENFTDYPSDLDNSLVIADEDNSSVDSNCKKDMDEAMGSNPFLDPFSPQQELVLATPREIPLSSTSLEDIFRSCTKVQDLAAQKPIEPSPSNSKRPESTDGEIKPLPENSKRKEEQELILATPREIPSSSTNLDHIFRSYTKVQDLAAQKPIEPSASNSNKRPESTNGEIKPLPENSKRKQDIIYEKQSSSTKRIAARSSNSKKLSAKKPSTKKKKPPLQKAPTKKQNDKWIAYYRLMIRYKHEQNGSTDVPRHYKDKKLGCWVKHQRDKYRLGLVLPERVRLLDELGFHWTVRTRWNDMFQQLVEYKNRFGDTRVLEKWEELLATERDERTRTGASPATPSSPLPPLRYWVFRQRYIFKWGKLTEQRIKKLNGIGFQWDGNNFDKKDQQRFEEKLEFKQHPLPQSDAASAESNEREPIIIRDPQTSPK